MLKTNQQSNGSDHQLSGSNTSLFSHLIGGTSPDLELATCAYFDGISDDFSVLGMLDHIESWFSKFEAKPKVVLVGSNEKKSPRHTVKSMRVAATADDTAFRRSVNNLQFFPKGRTTIDDTWRPSVYFAVNNTERRASAFFCVNTALDENDLLTILQEGDKLFRCCGAYGFRYPERFSPLGYYWGISVQPAGRRVGKWGERESKRLSHWRDNTSIGILSDGERRFFGVCDGYVRDAYSMMLLSDKHMGRRVGGSTLLERIRKENFGLVEAVGDKYLWRIAAEKLAAAQRLLDDNDISLSGRRLEGVKDVECVGAR